MNAPALTLPTLAVLGLLACGGGDSREIDRHVEDLVTIDHGVYGQTTASGDVGEPTVDYLPGFGVEVYARPSSATLGAPIATAESGTDRAFYQVRLDAGDYVVCTRFRRCVALTLPDGGPVRLDYDFGAGPGWSGAAITTWPPAP